MLSTPKAYHMDMAFGRHSRTTEAPEGRESARSVEESYDG